ncbi:MAG: SurA N-terminal domain-containing protein, partial [Sphingomonadaceae bacterium]|nr:SurA N-terminal domain-containing protein [Sphingomonadaceae bacterium]
MDGHPAGDFSGALSRRKRTECVIYKIKTKLLASLAICGLVTAPIAATAQGTGNTLGIPDNFTMMGQNDPNVRTATAVVNGQVITGTDIDQRVALVLAANESALSAEELQRLRMQVLRNLIDETLQIQEARAQEIEIQQAEIDQTYARVAAQNFGQDTKKMDEYLISIGSSAASLKRQIHGEL